ncbi:MAG: hypothetical protein E7295_11130 [Lachnospiraceae bacterium]|jgi:hypothetical protein|nr:hypothetical protein [Lachnospiraceae bacterium]
MASETNTNDKRVNAHDSEQKKKINKQNKKLGYILLYATVLILIILGEIFLFVSDPDASLMDLLKDTVGNLMGVLAAFLVFDIAHEWMSKESYASEISEQILDTLMYHPEAMELYENDQKKVFVNAFIGSIVNDKDAAEMIENHLETYLLTPEDFKQKSYLTAGDCRIKTAFSYRFVLETERTQAFQALRTDSNRDPYFYVQEELNYTVKYLDQKGNNMNSEFVKIGLIYDNGGLDAFLRGSKNGEEREVFKNCIFREILDIDAQDKAIFKELQDQDHSAELRALAHRMFRPHLTIDRTKGELYDVQVGSYKGRDYGLLFTFKVAHDQSLMEHDVSLIFHMPKRWDSIIEVALVDPTKDPQISISYNEDAMDVEMYSFLNKGDASSYDNTLEEENGVYSIALSNEWVYPMSGVVFFVRKDARVRAKEEALRAEAPMEKKQPDDRAQVEEKAQDKKQAASGEARTFAGNGEKVPSGR